MDDEPEFLACLDAIDRALEEEVRKHPVVTGYSLRSVALGAALAHGYWLDKRPSGPREAPAMESGE